MLTDTELLRRYVQNGSESAFGELVQRHINLVYCTALRILGGNEHHAYDVAQSVFADLARKAGSLCPRENQVEQGNRDSSNSWLTGWLYTSTRFAASKLVRTEQTRQRCEQRALQMSTMLETDSAGPDWTSVRPVLDQAMGQLDEDDRWALLMRFFEGKDLLTIGTILGVSQDAARMRITRALEKLRNALAKRGVNTTAAALSVTLAAHAAETAPLGLAAAVTSASLNAAVLVSSNSTIGVLHIMASVKSKIALAALLAGAIATPVLIQRGTIRQLRADNDTLRSQLGSAQVAQSSAPTNTPVPEQLAADRADQSELLRLRGEVTRLRAETARAKASGAAAEQKNSSPRREAGDTVGGYEVFTQNLLSERHANNIKSLKLLALGLGRLRQNATLSPEMRAMSFSEDNPLRQELKQTITLPDEEWNQFEILAPNLQALQDVGTNAGVIVARAKESIQTPDGRWVRVYGLSDGSVLNLIHDSANKALDFGELENSVSPNKQ